MFVTNAAIAIFGPFAQTTTQNWPKLMATDLDSVYFGSREALPYLLKTKGTIINVFISIRSGWRLGAQFVQCGKGRHYQLYALPSA
jgi:meso-butanediol dehydrogenase / (S,S)-butanediol dehydrogenase / diacetyl reductase